MTGPQEPGQWSEGEVWPPPYDDGPAPADAPRPRRRTRPSAPGPSTPTYPNGTEHLGDQGVYRSSPAGRSAQPGSTYGTPGRRPAGTGARNAPTGGREYGRPATPQPGREYGRPAGREYGTPGGSGEQPARRPSVAAPDRPVPGGRKPRDDRRASTDWTHTPPPAGYQATEVRHRPDEQLLPSLDGTDGPSAPARRRAGRRSRRIAMIAGFCVVALLIGGAGYWFLTRSGSDPKSDSGSFAVTSDLCGKVDSDPLKKYADSEKSRRHNTEAIGDQTSMTCSISLESAAPNNFNNVQVAVYANTYPSVARATDAYAGATRPDDASKEPGQESGNVSDLGEQASYVARVTDAGAFSSTDYTLRVTDSNLLLEIQLYFGSDKPVSKDQAKDAAVSVARKVMDGLRD